MTKTLAHGHNTSTAVQGSPLRQCGAGERGPALWRGRRQTGAHTPGTAPTKNSGRDTRSHIKLQPKPGGGSAWVCHTPPYPQRMQGRCSPSTQEMKCAPTQRHPEELSGSAALRRQPAGSNEVACRVPSAAQQPPQPSATGRDGLPKTAAQPCTTQRRRQAGWAYRSSYYSEPYTDFAHASAHPSQGLPRRLHPPPLVPACTQQAPQASKSVAEAVTLTGGSHTVQGRGRRVQGGPSHAVQRVEIVARLQPPLHVGKAAHVLAPEPCKAARVARAVQVIPVRGPGWGWGG